MSKSLSRRLSDAKNINEEEFLREYEREQAKYYWFPPYMKIVAWILCFVIATTCMVILILYGASFGPLKSEHWLSTVLISILTQTFLIQPIKILVMALLSSFVVKWDRVMVYKNLTKDLFTNPPDAERQKIAEAIRREYAHCYRPPDPALLPIRREQIKRRIEIRMIVTDLIIYTLFFIILYYVIYTDKTSAAFNSFRAVRNMVIYGNYTNSMPLGRVATLNQFMEYMNKTLIPGLMRNTSQTPAKTDQNDTKPDKDEVIDGAGGTGAQDLDYDLDEDYSGNDTVAKHGDTVHEYVNYYYDQDGDGYDDEYIDEYDEGEDSGARNTMVSEQPFPSNEVEKPAPAPAPAPPGKVEEDGFVEAPVIKKLTNTSTNLLKNLVDKGFNRENNMELYKFKDDVIPKFEWENKPKHNDVEEILESEEDKPASPLKAGNELEKFESYSDAVDDTAIEGDNKAYYADSGDGSSDSIDYHDDDSEREEFEEVSNFKVKKRDVKEPEPEPEEEPEPEPESEPVPGPRGKFEDIDSEYYDESGDYLKPEPEVKYSPTPTVKPSAKTHENMEDMAMERQQDVPAAATTAKSPDSDLHPNVFFPAADPKPLPPPLLIYKSWTMDPKIKLMGKIRLRQVRVTGESCYRHHTLVGRNDDCTASLNRFNVEHGNFDLGWQAIRLEDPEASQDFQPWTYRTPQETGDITESGRYSSYPAGGYVLPLGKTIVNCRMVLKYLEFFNWVDSKTRAVFVQFTLYSVDSNLFNVVTIIFEITASGVFVPSYHIFTAPLFFRNQVLFIVMVVLGILFFFFIFYFAFREGVRLNRIPAKSYFCHGWPVLDLIIILLALLILGIFAARNIHINAVFHELNDNPGKHFTNFRYVAELDEVTSFLKAFLIFVGTIRIFQIFTFIEVVQRIEKTIRMSFSYVFGAFLAYLMIITAYSALIHGFIGSQREPFSTFHGSIPYMMTISRRGEDMEMFILQFAPPVGQILYLVLTLTLLVLIFYAVSAFLMHYRVFAYKGLKSKHRDIRTMVKKLFRGKKKEEAAKENKEETLKELRPEPLDELEDDFVTLKDDQQSPVLIDEVRFQAMKRIFLETIRKKSYGDEAAKNIAAMVITGDFRRPAMNHYGIGREEHHNVIVTHQQMEEMKKITEQVLKKRIMDQRKLDLEHLHKEMKEK